jgi:hypothetical protein
LMKASREEVVARTFGFKKNPKPVAQAGFPLLPNEINKIKGVSGIVSIYTHDPHYPFHIKGTERVRPRRYG